MGYVTSTRIAGYVGILYLETEMYQQLFRVEHFYFEVIRTRLGILVYCYSTQAEMPIQLLNLCNQ